MCQNYSPRVNTRVVEYLHPTTPEYQANGSAIKGLGEVALRMNSLAQMTRVKKGSARGSGNWIKWGSLYFHDPEGNELELVYYNQSLKLDAHRRDSRLMAHRETARHVCLARDLSASGQMRGVIQRQTTLEMVCN